MALKGKLKNGFMKGRQMKPRYTRNSGGKEKPERKVKVET